MVWGWRQVLAHERRKRATQGVGRWETETETETVIWWVDGEDRGRDTTDVVFHISALHIGVGDVTLRQDATVARFGRRRPSSRGGIFCRFLFTQSGGAHCIPSLPKDVLLPLLLPQAARGDPRPADRVISRTAFRKGDLERSGDTQVQTGPISLPTPCSAHTSTGDVVVADTNTDTDRGHDHRNSPSFESLINSRHTHPLTIGNDIEMTIYHHTHLYMQLYTKRAMTTCTHLLTISKRLGMMPRSHGMSTVSLMYTGPQTLTRPLASRLRTARMTL